MPSHQLRPWAHTLLYVQYVTRLLCMCIANNKRVTLMDLPFTLWCPGSLSVYLFFIFFFLPDIVSPSTLIVCIQ